MLTRWTRRCRAAYESQDFLPGALSGYCAAGVVPRDTPDACKVRTVDTQAIEKVNAAVATFDALLAQCIE